MFGKNLFTVLIKLLSINKQAADRRTAAAVRQVVSITSLECEECLFLIFFFFISKS